MALYGKLQYWEERYTYSGDGGTYDWYQTYGDLRHLLTADILKKPFSGIARLQALPSKDIHLPNSNAQTFPSRESCRVLILGCGNSSFGEDMVNDGWAGEIVNIDFSSVVINQMMKKQENKHQGKDQQPEMKFVCADITHGLPFGDSSFDLIICKGTLDAILCSNGSVSSVKRLIAECDRVLAPGHGCLFVVTHGTPDNRVVFLEHGSDPTYYWEGICIDTVPKRNQITSQNDYVYICRKKITASNNDDTRKEDGSRIPKIVGEENIELTGDKTDHKPAHAGDSHN